MTKTMFDKEEDLILLIMVFALEIGCGIYIRNMISPFIGVMILIAWFVFIDKRNISNEAKLNR